MTKLSETKCRRCAGLGTLLIPSDEAIMLNMEGLPTCPMCNGKGYEKETVSGYAPVASINHEGRD